jgi:hypothetical protein
MGCKIDLPCVYYSMYDSVYIYMYILNYCFHDRASFFGKTKTAKTTKLKHLYILLTQKKQSQWYTITYNIDYKHDSTVN